MTKESKRNLNRVTKYNSHTSRGVDNINPLNTYNKEFSATNTSAILNIDVKEMPNPCTINPPIVDSWCTTEWNGEWVGGGQTPGTCFAANCCGGMLVNWHIIEDSFQGTSDYIIDYREVFYEVPIDNPEMTYYQKLLEQAERNLATIRRVMESRLNYIYPMQLQALIDIYEYYEGTGQGAAYFCDIFGYPVYDDAPNYPLRDWYLGRYGESVPQPGGGSWLQFWNFVWLMGYPVDHIAKELPTYTNPIAPENLHLGGWYRGDLIWSEKIYEEGFYPYFEPTKHCVPFVRSPYEYMGQVDFDVPRSIEELRALKEYWDLFVFDYSWFEQQVVDAQALIDAAPPPPDVEPVISSYVIKQNGIVIPEDGCYLVTYQGRGWGVSYFNDAIQRAYILHNNSVVASGENDSTGRIILLGPVIYYWPPITNLVAYVEARAGDSISCFSEASGFHKCYPWVGTFLKGDYGPYGSTLSIKLVASAEGVRALEPKELFVDEYQEERVIVDAAAATSVWQRTAGAQVVIV